MIMILREKWWRLEAATNKMQIEPANIDYFYYQYY